MIRPITLVCALIAALSGLYLYHVKHATQLLERSITRTNQSIEAARERAGVLRAEWTLMNDPERLAELAGQFLKLGTVSPRQFTTVADLGTRLPPVRTLPVRPDVSTDTPATDLQGAGDDPTDPAAEAPLPLPPPAPPRAVAAVAPRPAAPPAAATPASFTPASSAPASFTPAAPVAQPRAPIAPTPVAAQRVQLVAPLPVSQPAVAPPPARPVSTGSALGMARGIVAPPVPVGGEIHLMRGN